MSAPENKVRCERLPRSKPVVDMHRCDAATTNTWPCSACTRLKLHCVPPTVHYDHDLPVGTVDPEQYGAYTTSADGSGSGNITQAEHFQAPYGHNARQLPLSNGPPHMEFDPGLSAYQTTPFLDRSAHHAGVYQDLAVSQLQVPSDMYTQPGQNMFPTPTTHLSPSYDTSRTFFEGENMTSAESLTGAFGDLKIDENGVGMLFLSP